MIPAHVGVLGGGRMGAGIAHAFLLAGAHVTVVEADQDASSRAADRITETLRRSVEREPEAHALDALTARLSTTTDVAAFADADLIIEAVPEDRDLKFAALALVERAVAPTAVIASNTSSIPIGALAARLEDPTRFLGLHFFNPVPSSALVEVVIGPATDPGLADRARDWIATLGKTAIVVRDSPGFASSRLGVALALEAIRMLEEGVASAEDIDRAMELGYRHPIGPLRTTDLVGLDVRLGIAEELQRELGDRFTPPELLRRKVAEGAVGRKAGRGFYEWSTDQ